ncbi:substrate-binding periplasmic protein [Shimia haliotis]|uniref:Polar amino acid transport system substrate-binding protein n=1 Tax=Shimia haliotis TaxID=1280847 RepID=A0A1I4CSS5_9RHOB|nr:transporter substrate-binding domain-containing protein [Shimia haliotis]SFK83086.1 polar amino acid transport system substrate-binding protein [Shimia haliotis]
MKTGYLISAFFLSVGMASSVQAETITIAAGDWAPYIGEALPDNGTHTKRVREVMKAAGYDIELEYMPWKRSYELAKKGDYVATFSWSYTDERGADFHFPQEPLEEHYDVFFYSKSKHPNGLSVNSISEVKELGLKPVGLAGYWYEKAFADAGVEMHTVTSTEAAWRLLEAGRADVMIENEIAGEAYVRDVLGEGEQSIGKTGVLRSVAMHILFSKAHPDGEALRDAWDANTK